jgi:hypothetical protein
MILIPSVPAQRIGPDKNIHCVGPGLYLAGSFFACLFREFRCELSALLNVLFRLVQFLPELLLLPFYDRDE